MKKVIACLLSVVLLVAVWIPAGAAVEPGVFGRVNDRIPTVLIAGDGDAIFVPDDTVEGGERKVFAMGDFLSAKTDGLDKDAVYESIANVVQPYLKEGLLKNNFQPYYDALEKEIGELFTEVRLDENGDPQFGSRVSGWDGWVNWYNQNNDNKGDKGFYDREDYHFWYDWRLDPMLIAQQLHDYVQNVKRVTGAEKVSLISSCLGSNVALAYLAQFDTDDFYGLAVDATLANGAEFISESLSGGVKIDGAAIQRFLSDAAAIGWFSLPDFANATVDLAIRSGLLDGVVKFTRATVYDKVVEGVTSAVALGAFFTMPCYWACIAPEDYETAKLYVFGPEGSEKRQKYAGLIEKIDNYHEKVGLHTYELMQKAADNGLRMCIVAKYGMQMIPISQSREAVGDQFVSINKATFGATTSTVYSTLSDDYIAQREAQGKGKYLSPDKQIDASTAVFPDYTFFIKGADHTRRSRTEDEILYTCVTADRQLTPDDFEWSQFMIYDRDNDVMHAMTEENCHVESWPTDKEATYPTSFFGKLKAYFQSLSQWLRAFFAFLKSRNAEA